MKPIVLGYYPEWSTLPPAKVDYSLYTHLCHAFAGVLPDGTLALPNTMHTQELIRQAHAKKVKVILSLGGADSNTRLVAATKTPAATNKLAETLAKAIIGAGYDGLDVDWEAPTNPGEMAQMNALVKALREQMPKALLTMATPSTDWAGKWFATASLAPYLDFVNVMTYDLYGPWSDRAGHHAGMGPATGDSTPEAGVTVPAAVDYWLKSKKWPKEKLVLGIPLYGRGFRAAKFGDAAKGEYERSGISYQDILQLRKQGWKVHQDATAKVPYLEKPDGSEVLSYEDPASAQRKGEYARKQRLGGIFFWEISQDFDGKTNPIVRAAAKGLKG